MSYRSISIVEDIFFLRFAVTCGDGKKRQHHEGHKHETSPNEDTVFSLDQPANKISPIAYITLSRLASEPRGRTPSGFWLSFGPSSTYISTHCNMTSSAKKFVLTASMLALAEAASVLRRKINERDLEALECTRRRWHFTVGETLQW